MPFSQEPEFAFIGRSNVGKSSLINMLCNRKNLAKTSQKPGKTQLVNAFHINNTWRLIDLPGYGFAKVSQKKKGKFSDMILEYLSERKNLYCSFVLIDSRIPPQKIDLEFLDWCVVKEVPVAIVFTKSDKMNKTKLAFNTETFKAALFQRGWEELPPCFITSSAKHKGKDEVLDFINSILKEN